MCNLPEYLESNDDDLLCCYPVLTPSLRMLNADLSNFRRTPDDGYKHRYNDFSNSTNSRKSLAYFAASCLVGRGNGLRAKPPYP